jgi:two-component system sensor histidine kinase RegB
VWYVPLPSVHGRFGGDFNLHIAGMWVNFLVASVLTAVFVATLASRVRATDGALMRARERQLRDEHIVSLGTLAAGAAHELSTPLTTLRLLLDEIEAEGGALADRDRIELLRRQLDLMQDRLAVLRMRSEEVRSEAATPMPVRAFVEQVVDRWRAARPDIIAELVWPDDFDDVRIVAEETVAQALASVLNNAADASQATGVNRIRVSPECVSGKLKVAVRDWGDGVPKYLGAGQAPRFGTTKAHGHGVGLVLSHASLERLGGALRFARAGDTGSVVSLELPLAGLAGTARHP